VVLGDVASASKEKCDPSDGSIKRYVAGEHMDTDDLKIHRWGTVGDGYLGPAFHRRFRPGQVLYGSRRTYLRKVAVADFDGVCANTTFVVESKDPGVLLREFLPFIMTTEPFHAFAIAESRGSVNPYVNWSDIARYEFDLPPLDEQRRIAELLWAVERERDATRDLLAKVDEVSSIWSGVIFRHAGAERAIGDMLDLCQYGLSSRAGDAGAYPMLRMTNLIRGTVTDWDLKYCDLSEGDFRSYQLRDGDILFNRTNSVELVGRSGIFNLPGNFVFASYLIRLRTRSADLLPEYLNEFINSPLGQKRIRVHISKGVSQANISASKLRTVNIPVPSVGEQREVVERLNNIQHSRSSITERGVYVAQLAQQLRNDVFGDAL
jgi:restriction endonuclease S subunit